MHTAPNPVSRSSRAIPLPFLVPRREPERRFFDGQPPVPVLPATGLQLVLLLDQRTLDLQAITDVILTDVGATLQVFRVTSALAGQNSHRAKSLDECVVLLGPKRLRKSLISHPSVEGARAVGAIRALSARARLTAELAATIARQFPEVSCQSAYAAGLLHELGHIPTLLRWTVPGVDLSETRLVGSLLAAEWGLPDFIDPTLQFEIEPAPPCSRLRRIVTVAWNMANIFSRRRSLAPRAEALMTGLRTNFAPYPVHGLASVSSTLDRS